MRRSVIKPHIRETDLRHAHILTPTHTLTCVHTLKKTPTSLWSGDFLQQAFSTFSPSLGSGTVSDGEQVDEWDSSSKGAHFSWEYRALGLPVSSLNLHRQKHRHQEKRYIGGGESRKRSSVRPSVASDERSSMRELPERCLAIHYVLSGPDLQEALMPGVSESRP